jgi:peptidoglycan/LPS O-acetylase OafA/YrhL
VEKPNGENERFPALDGLRAFAMSAVICHHAGPTGTFLDRGLGVNTFFAISGFLITTLLLREQTRTGDISVPRFYLRRALRIVPLYYAVLLLYVGLVWFMERDPVARAQFFANVPLFATFTANWALAESPGRHVLMLFAWSLSTQEQFYLVWPWVMRAVRRRRTVVFLVLAVLVVVEVSWIPLTTADGIWIGCLVGYLWQTRRGKELLRFFAGSPWSAPAALAAVLLPLAWPSCPQIETVAATGWLVTACALRPGILGPLLEWRPLRWVGSVSYGMFLLHMLAMNVARRILPWHGRVPVFAVALVLSVAAGGLAHRLIDGPVARLRAKLLAVRALAPELRAAAAPPA